jgi:hypothetical protein
MCKYPVFFSLQHVSPRAYPHTGTPSACADFVWCTFAFDSASAFPVRRQQCYDHAAGRPGPRFALRLHNSHRYSKQLCHAQGRRPILPTVTSGSPRLLHTQYAPATLLLCLCCPCTRHRLIGDSQYWYTSIALLLSQEYSMLCNQQPSLICRYPSAAAATSMALMPKIGILLAQYWVS